MLVLRLLSSCTRELLRRGCGAGRLSILAGAHKPESGTLVFIIPARTSTIPLRSGRAVTVASWFSSAIITSCPICTSLSGTKSRAACGLAVVFFKSPSVSLRAISRARTARWAALVFSSFWMRRSSSVKLYASFCTFCTSSLARRRAFSSSSCPWRISSSRFFSALSSACSAS